MLLGWSWPRKARAGFHPLSCSSLNFIAVNSNGNTILTSAAQRPPDSRQACAAERAGAHTEAVPTIRPDAMVCVFTQYLAVVFTQCRSAHNAAVLNQPRRVHSAAVLTERRRAPSAPAN